MKHVLAFGGGRDSTALLALHLNREKFSYLQLDKHLPAFDAVVFSDTGAEFPETYENIEEARRQCEAVDLPFHVVRKDGETITEWVLRVGIIPLMPGGRHVCSLKFKGEVMAKWAKANIKDTVQWIIGIEADEGRRAKRFQAAPGAVEPLYPLMAMGIKRDDLSVILEKAWPIEVRKSSCFFCPFMQREEIEEVRDDYPKLWQVTKKIEATFQATSPRKHQAWLDAGKPLNKAGRALKGMWRLDSWAEGARLFVSRVDGKSISCEEWEAQKEEQHARESVL